VLRTPIKRQTKSLKQLEFSINSSSKAKSGLMIPSRGNQKDPINIISDTWTSTVHQKDFATGFAHVSVEVLCMSAANCEKVDGCELLKGRAVDNDESTYLLFIVTKRMNLLIRMVGIIDK